MRARFAGKSVARTRSRVVYCMHRACYRRDPARRDLNRPTGFSPWKGQPPTSYLIPDDHTARTIRFIRSSYELFFFSKPISYPGRAYNSKVNERHRNSPPPRAIAIMLEINTESRVRQRSVAKVPRFRSVALLVGQE